MFCKRRRRARIYLGAQIASNLRTHSLRRNQFTESRLIAIMDGHVLVKVLFDMQSSPSWNLERIIPVFKTLSVKVMTRSQSWDKAAPRQPTIPHALRASLKMGAGLNCCSHIRFKRIEHMRWTTGATGLFQDMSFWAGSPYDQLHTSRNTDRCEA